MSLDEVAAATRARPATGEEGLLDLFESEAALRYSERTVSEYVAHVRAFLAERFAPRRPAPRAAP